MLKMCLRKREDSWALFVCLPPPRCFQEAEQVRQPEWPENGEEWSDGGEEVGEEEEAGMDCGLLQAMAEEDEEINVHNEETFGMGEQMIHSPFRRHLGVN